MASGSADGVHPAVASGSAEGRHPAVAGVTAEPIPGPVDALGAPVEPHDVDPIATPDAARFGLRWTAAAFDAEGPRTWAEADGIRLRTSALGAMEGQVELRPLASLRVRAAGLLVGHSGGPWLGRAQELHLAAVFGGHELLLGRATLRWGHGAQGSLLLGRSAPPLWQARWRTNPRNLPILRPFGAWDGEVFLAYLDDADRRIADPLLFGHRFAWYPAGDRRLELWGARTILFGGEGRTSRLTAGDVANMLLGRNENLVGERGPGDSDQRASFGVRWELPWVERWLGPGGGITGFYEYGGEDFLNPPLPSAVAYHYGGGLALRRWGLDVEFVETVTGKNRWYDAHTVYGRSHFYRGYPLGLEAGTDVESLRMGLRTPPVQASGGAIAQGRLTRVEQRYGVASGDRERRVGWTAGARLRWPSGRALELEIARGRRIGHGREPTAPPLIRHLAAIRWTVLG